MMHHIQSPINQSIMSQALSVKEGSSTRAELDDLKAALARVKRQYDEAEEVRHTGKGRSRHVSPCKMPKTNYFKYLKAISPSFHTIS